MKLWDFMAIAAIKRRLGEIFGRTDNVYTRSNRVNWVFPAFYIDFFDMRMREDVVDHAWFDLSFLIKHYVANDISDVFDLEDQLRDVGHRLTVYFRTLDIGGIPHRITNAHWTKMGGEGNFEFTVSLYTSIFDYGKQIEGDFDMLYELDLDIKLRSSQ